MSDDKITVVIDKDLEDLIPGFLANRKKDLNSLSNALQSRDFTVLQSIGHSLKGVGGGYGFERMSEIGANLENAAREKSAMELADLIESYADYLARVDIIFE